VDKLSRPFLSNHYAISEVAEDEFRLFLCVEFVLRVMGEEGADEEQQGDGEANQKLGAVAVEQSQGCTEEDRADGAAGRRLRVRSA
jgi:hypothetical protein